MSDEELEAAQKLAHELGVSTGELVRRLLREAGDR
jgi:hypothetical protein